MYRLGGESLAPWLAKPASPAVRFDHSIVNDPNLILGQIIMLLRRSRAGAVAADCRRGDGGGKLAPMMLGGPGLQHQIPRPQLDKLNHCRSTPISRQTAAELAKAIMKAVLMGTVAACGCAGRE
ncbi:hypothetical protein ACNKHQ_11125 [Shigella flexneri]